MHGGIEMVDVFSFSSMQGNIHTFNLGTFIALYFYLSGLSAGAFVISSLYNLFGMGNFTSVAKTSGTIAAILALTAPLSLLAGFWQPEVYVLFAGDVWKLVFGAYVLVCLIYSYSLLKGGNISKVFGILGVPLAVAVHKYTVYFFGTLESAMPIYSMLMQSYFLISALVSGFGLVIFISMLQKYRIGGVSMEVRFKEAGGE